jgi:hypothetical protein
MLEARWILMRHTIIGLVWFIIFYMAIGSAVYLVKRKRNWSLRRSYGHVISKTFYYFATVAMYMGLFFATFGGLNLLVGVDRHAMSIVVGIAGALLSYVFRWVGKYWVEFERQRLD